MLGFQVIHKPTPERYADRWHNTLFGGIQAGWYWTDHLKTELDFGAGTEASHYSVDQRPINGQPAIISRESTFSRQTIGVGQHYQFFRNAWFHPHLGAGVNVTRERVTDTIGPAIVYGPTGPSRVVEPQRIDGPRTEVSVSPFVAAGFKAYLASRAFFRTDIRGSLNRRVDDVLVRVGFGVDF